MITDPGDKTYVRGKAITAFDIEVTDAEDEAVTVTVTGLPDGAVLRAPRPRRCPARCLPSAAVQAYTATISADDGTNAAVTETFTVTVPGPSAAVTVADAERGRGRLDHLHGDAGQGGVRGLTVTPSFTDVTATEGTDYTANTSALTFTGTAGETKTFTVATTEDTDAELNETFTVGLAVSETTVEVTASDTATGTITNDDGAPPAVTIEDVSAAEGDSITFTVTLDKAVSGSFSVTPSFTNGTATEGADYTENTAAISFAGTAGETQTFTVATTEDTVVEADETFTVSLSVSGRRRR